jgi:peroxiredoxin family protein
MDDGSKPDRFSLNMFAHLHTLLRKMHICHAQTINSQTITRILVASMSEKKKLALIVHSGTLDKLYCAFILGSTATTMGWEAHLYFTFWGLQALVKGAMEKAGLPSDYRHMEKQMRERLKQMKYPTPYDLLKRMKDSGLLTIYACTPTMEMFGIKREDLIPEVDKMAGATTFLSIAATADVTLLV